MYFISATTITSMARTIKLQISHKPNSFAIFNVFSSICFFPTFPRKSFVAHTHFHFFNNFTYTVQRDLNKYSEQIKLFCNEFKQCY